MHEIAGGGMRGDATLVQAGVGRFHRRYLQIPRLKNTIKTSLIGCEK